MNLLEVCSVAAVLVLAGDSRMEESQTVPLDDRPVSSNR
jgi:hypothetical protein